MVSHSLWTTIEVGTTLFIVWYAWYLTEPGPATAQLSTSRSGGTQVQPSGRLRIASELGVAGVRDWHGRNAYAFVSALVLDGVGVLAK
jgi:hypothetical protein